MYGWMDGSTSTSHIYTNPVIWTSFSLSTGGFSLQTQLNTFLEKKNQNLAGPVLFCSCSCSGVCLSSISSWNLSYFWERKYQRKQRTRFDRCRVSSSVPMDITSRDVLSDWDRDKKIGQKAGTPGEKQTSSSTYFKKKKKKGKKERNTLSSQANLPKKTYE